MFIPANKSTLHDDVLAQMIEAIVEGRWTQGGRLPGEQTLAEQFQVSRNCIREVLKALALSGIVEARPGRGTFLSHNALRQLNGNKFATTMFDETSLRELMEVRWLIEGQVAYWSAERATDAQIKNLEKILKQRKKSMIDKNTHFHDALAKIAGNKLLTRLLESIHVELDASRRRFSEWSNETLEEYTSRHLEIYDRIKARDPEGARQAMIDHVLFSWKELMKEEELLQLKTTVAKVES